MQNFCSHKLELSGNSSRFGRLHRVDHFVSDKCESMIVKLTLFKDKQNILASTRKLKRSIFSIQEDFSLSTRAALEKIAGICHSTNETLSVSGG